MEKEPQKGNRVYRSEMPQNLLDNIKELKRESSDTFWMIIRYRIGNYKNRYGTIFININDIKEILPDDNDIFSIRYDENGKDTVLKFPNGPFLLFFSRKKVYPQPEDEILPETPIYIRLYEDAYVLF